MVKKLAIIMLGAPGSGKGTQGEILEKNTKFKRYVMSDLLKLELKPGSDKYKKIMKGELLSNTDIFDIFKKYFKSENNIILDGIIRTEDQAYWLYGFLIRQKYEIKLIFLNVDEKKLVKRITSRWYCPKCHRVYNTIIDSKKPKKNGICDDDSSKLVQRKDDTKEIFKDRIKIFDETKRAILDVYNSEIIEVDADRNIEVISNEVLKKLKI